MIFLLTLLLAVLLPLPEPWAALLVVTGAVLEVGEVALLRRWSKRLARRLPTATGTEAMIGSTGKVVTPCRPSGTVRLRGELWDALCDEGADVGAAVRVDAVDALVLVVSPVLPERRRDGAGPA